MELLVSLGVSLLIAGGVMRFTTVAVSHHLAFRAHQSQDHHQETARRFLQNLPLHQESNLYQRFPPIRHPFSDHEPPVEGSRLTDTCPEFPSGVCLTVMDIEPPSSAFCLELVEAQWPEHLRLSGTVVTSLEQPVFLLLDPLLSFVFQAQQIHEDVVFLIPPDQQLWHLPETLDLLGPTQVILLGGVHLQHMGLIQEEEESRLISRPIRWLDDQWQEGRRTSVTGPWTSSILIEEDPQAWLLSYEPDAQEVCRDERIF
jgi:hypothetical protein